MYCPDQLNAGRRNTEGIAGKNSTVARAQPPLKRVRESCWEAAADSDFPPLKRVRIGGTTASVAGTRQFFPILPAPECQPLDIPKPAWTAPSRGPSSMKLHMRMLLSQIRLIDLPTLHQSNFWKDLEVRSKAAIPRVKVQDLLHASFAEGTKFIPGKELRGFTFSVATSARACMKFQAGLEYDPVLRRLISCLPEVTKEALNGLKKPRHGSDVPVERDHGSYQCGDATESTTGTRHSNIPFGAAPAVRDSATSDRTLVNGVHGNSPLGIIATPRQTHQPGAPRESRFSSVPAETLLGGRDPSPSGAQSGDGLWTDKGYVRRRNPAKDDDEDVGYTFGASEYMNRDHEEEDQEPAGDAYSTGISDMRRGNSGMSVLSNNSEGLDPDDPRVTGMHPNHRDEQDMEKNVLRHMDYRTRRKYLQRVRIEFNVASLRHRQRFLLKLARALMTFGAPSHRIESQLIAAARILEVQAEFIHLPGVIICSFGEQETGGSETHFVKSNGRLALGLLHKVHLIYRSVVHDEISATQAIQKIDALLKEPPLYPWWIRCIISFWLSVLICPLAFGGSFVDMWFAGISAFVLAFLQLQVAQKSTLYANVFEISVSIVVSFVARALSSVKSQIFCYTAISSSGIIGILPGYLIQHSMWECKDGLCPHLHSILGMTFGSFPPAGITPIQQGFGLQIGSDFFLLLDKPYRQQLDQLEAGLNATISFAGIWSADNGTSHDQVPLSGTWTFSKNMIEKKSDIIVGCYRPARFPWYLQPFPLWTSFIIVPLFSILSSLGNLQPLRSKQLPVMVAISCCSYAANKIANHYIFNRSDVVSAIGAFTVGLLGNMYSRKMGGTAFTSMVTGVLFLVPSGLSSAGGITAHGDGIEIGGAMIAVTIGITVGLFMSQALVYTFGSRKNAAVFSF
ncbi:DUF1212 domain membrane protein [Coprinopsis cinerea okayama7|uniref:DUF1212 domain membrane protein n=1 Tax=Coprinopsis cinerea (strain Okayama-7 / 130 / ATCC MYA-4618 / FGSC 9003) TaxID=240176 RepID=A8NXV7_COPC7|nr:DUF1212 domain membrane protein [Coprinopsis cinerea okayama7\|eukprot:XP_001837280.2 DUF1212 domain membrane protein [Coprinopsis cinerea okayama7\